MSLEVEDEEDGIKLIHVAIRISSLRSTIWIQGEREREGDLVQKHTYTGE